VKTIAILFVAAFVGGCGAGGSTDRPGDEFTPPPSPDGGATFAPKSPAAGSNTLTGVLSFDAIEGGCSFLLTPDGTRYEVVYPAGWAIDMPSGTLRGPGGEVVPAGDTVIVHGSIATDMASICQIGPIFIATAVELPPS
jgi:hypothetical protein